jgi:mRNA-degrading endonuclease RelE of RelBE toxin-antitoxin system
VPEYTLTITAGAAKGLTALPTALMRRVDAAILAFAHEPRPHGVKSSKENGRSGASGSATTRIIDSVDDETRLVDIIGIPHRSQGYR